MDSFKAFAMGKVGVIGLRAAHLRSARAVGGRDTPARHRLRRFELGLREGRSSTELRWPPAKIHAWRPRVGDGLRPKYT
jgi:hypothetical protein